jgi:hypothetical protein
MQSVCVCCSQDVQELALLVAEVIAVVYVLVSLLICVFDHLQQH